ncbi:SAMC1 [Scenedesmus sp. PABB004]|nr:SAMC1 [Scenedesmus sp. PABB004]
MRSTRGARIYFSLLALCYLEIVLWTACLVSTASASSISPAEALSGHSYLQRETGNLKAFAGRSQPPAPLFEGLERALLLSEQQRLAEHLCQQLRFNAASDIASSLLHQPASEGLRALPALQGLPAPDSANTATMEPEPARPGGRQRWLPFRLRLGLPGLPGPLRGIRLPGTGGGRAAPKATAFAATTVSLSGAARAAGGGGGAGAPAAAPPRRGGKAPAAKPASDVLAGALARALSQSTIHPLDTLKVRMQARGLAGGGPAAPAAAPAAAAAPPGLSKFGQLVPPPGGRPDLAAMGAGLASLYKGVVGAASGAGIAIGAYFAVYGVACNAIGASTDLSPSAVAFVSGGIAAAGSSVVKVPLAVCIRSVQAGVYPNVFAAASAITARAGPRGLFTGFFPTLLEDVPDMAVKFAAYESMRQLHAKLSGGRPASPQEDFAMGATAGALAAGCTTPLDVIKTRMMCAAASRPTMAGAAAEILAASGPRGFLAGLGPRALSNGINSAVFFCFFEAIRGGIHARAHVAAADAVAAWAAAARERAAGVPRALRGTLALALPPAVPSRGGGGGDAGAGGLHWATAGAGGGLALLASAGRRGLGVVPGGCDDAEMLLACGGDVGARPGAAPLSLSLLARASPLRLEDGQLVMAVTALKRVEELEE